MGCTNIENWFDTNGIFLVNSLDDIENVLNSINEETYLSKIKSIEENFNISSDFVDFEKMIKKMVKVQ